MQQKTKSQIFKIRRT